MVVVRLRAVVVHRVDSSLIARYRSARRSLDHWLRVTERHGSLIRALTGDGIIQSRLHYPAGDLIDRVSGTQCYYHCHRGDHEHGHLHVFGRASLEAPLTHLLAISLDTRGLPVELFTVNQWVSRDVWLTAATTLAIMDRVSLQHSACDPSFALWLVHFLRFYRPQVQQLLIQRDRCLQQAASEPSQALYNRDLEILSSQSIDWSHDLAAIQATLVSVRQAKQRPQADSDRSAQQRKHDPKPAMQAGGGDPAEVSTHVAAVGEPGAVAHDQSADQGGHGSARRCGTSQAQTPRQGSRRRSSQHDANVHH